MSDYIGDFPEDYTNICIDFHTTWNGDMTALAGTPTLAVYKDNSDTEHTTTYTPAVVDSATGAYRAVIDASASAFFSTGSDYKVRFKTGTLGGKSLVGRLVKEFSIENRKVILASGKTHGGSGTVLHLETAAGNGSPFKIYSDGAAALDIFADNGAQGISIDAGIGIDITGDVFSGVKINGVSLDALLYLSQTTGAAQSATASTITLATGASATNNYYLDMVVYIPLGTGEGQAPRRITAYNATTKVATISPNWSVTPDNTSAYIILGRIE